MSAPTLPEGPRGIHSQQEEEPPNEFKPDYTAEEFTLKILKKGEAEKLVAESVPFDFSRGGVGPNSQEAFLIRTAGGEVIRFRQAMGLSAEGKNGNDCVSLKLPGQDPIVGFVGDGTLEVRQTDIKWAFVIILHGQHYFFEHIDSTTWQSPVLHKVSLTYFFRDSEGKLNLRGALSLWNPRYGRDPGYPLTSQGGHLDGPDHCRAPY